MATCINSRESFAANAITSVMIYPFGIVLAAFAMYVEFLSFALFFLCLNLAVYAIAFVALGGFIAFVSFTVYEGYTSLSAFLAGFTIIATIIAFTGFSLLHKSIVLMGISNR